MSPSKIIMRNNLNNLGKQYLWPKKILVLVFFSIALITSVILTILFAGQPKIISKSPEDFEILQLNQNIEVEFDKPIDISELNLSITPTTDGNWTFSKSLTDKLTKKIIFQPKDFYKPNQKYVIKFEGIRGVFNSSKNIKETSISFVSQKIPDVDKTSLDTESAEVNICNPIIVTLDQPNDKLADFNLRLTPENTFKKVISSDKLSYSFIPDPCLIQDQDYDLSVERTILVPNLEIMDKNTTSYRTKFRTRGSAGIIGFEPKGSSVDIGTKKIKIFFSKPMVQNEIAENISIRPRLSGDWSWQNNTILIFTATEPLMYNTDYTVEIAKGVHNQENETISENISLNFKTIKK
jgi:hypothetical protein